MSQGKVIPYIVVYVHYTHKILNIKRVSQMGSPRTNPGLVSLGQP